MYMEMKRNEGEIKMLNVYCRYKIESLWNQDA